MAKGFWVKTGASSIWKATTGFYVKVSPSTWQTVNDAWVKVKQTGTDSWQRFWQSATNPDSPIEILASYTSPGELLRLQGKNYHWTPNPSTLFYKFSYVDNNTATTYTLTSSTSTSNPSTGGSATLPGSATYRTISKNSSDNEYTIGGLSTYRFTVTGTTSSGAISVQNAEYEMRTPKAPTLAVERLSNTSVKITITSASGDDFAATYRYIVSTYDAIGGTIESGGGRGGYGATSDPTYVTLTGLTAGRLYYIYVTPFTGSAGSTEANATGYAGVTANITTQGESDYTFAFGNSLHVGTNGYISLDSGNVNDAISSTTGRVIGIFPGDLYQDTTTSIWYWSNTTQFIIRWEGYHYNQPANLRQYEIVFDVNQNYATVYAISVANTTEGTSAWVKDGVTKSSYVAALTTGAWRQVYFDGVTTPSTMFGPYITKSKSVMKQVTGFTSGTQDQGYTTIVTSTNQNVTPALGAFDISSFTKGNVAASSQGASRSTSLTWDSSTNATRYEIQYQGSNDDTNWTTVQTYGQSAYNTGTTETKTWSSQVGGDFTFYTFMRANIRASESTATAAYVYSNNSAYVKASGAAPGQPTFGTITKTGSTASIPFTVGTTGTNFLYTSIEYMYRSSTGSYPATWSTSVINSGAGTISLTGLSSSTTYYIKIRTRNYDELYSAENETTFQTNAGLSSPTISSVSYNTSNSTWTVNYTGGSGPFYQIWYQPVQTTSQPALTGTVSSAADAQSNSSSSTSKVVSATETYVYWWWVRSSNTLTGSGAGNVSDWNGPVTASPINTALPTLTGTTKVGNTLTYGKGTWLNASSTTTQLYRGTAGVNQSETFVASTTSASSTYILPSSDFTDTNNRKYYRSFSRGENASFNASYVAGTELGPLTNIVLYTITFDSKSGSAVSSLTQATEGGSISKPTDPTKTSNTFGGWATTDGGTTAVTWPRTPSANETLYAIWTAVASGPTVPTGLSVTGGAVSSNLSTSLTRNSATNKTQSWTTATSQAVSVSWTKGTGTGTITSEVKWNQTGVTPGASDSGTWTSISGSSQSDSNGGGTTNYYWVRTVDGNSVKSAWVYAGSYTATSPSMTGFSIRIYRGSGSGSTGFSSPTTAPSSTSTSGSNTYSGLINRDASPDFGHYAWASGTLNGVSKTAISSTV